MNKELIRLEVLKILFRHDRQPAQVVADAKEYEKYIFGTSDDKKLEGKAKPSPQKKQAGNPDILS